MNSPSSTEPQNALWTFVEADEYTLPSAPIGYTSAKDRILATLQKFWPSAKQTSPLLEEKEELRNLSPERVQAILPTLEWHDPAVALRAAIGTWLDAEEPANQVVFLVGPPYSGVSDILTDFAPLVGWQVVDAPMPAQILSGNDEVLRPVIEQDEPCVIPSLEHWFLRHALGLDLIRRLFSALDQRNQRCLVGCDSWAWAYFREVLDRKHSRVLCLQSFGEDRIEDWVISNIDREQTHIPWIREYGTGKYVLAPEQKEENGFESSDFLAHLAAYSRGIPGVSWHLLKTAFQSLPEKDIADEEQTDEIRQRHGGVWIAPWAQFMKPGVPELGNPVTLFVLHALLLHHGLSSELLIELLPVDADRVLRTLSLLRQELIVKKEQDQWQVADVGYPAVREFITSKSYLTDQF